MDKKIAQALVDANVVKFGEFTLASGMKSPVYVDIRILPSNPESFSLVVEGLSKIIKKLKMDVVAGAETAGIPLAAAIAIKLKMPMVYVRKNPKGYGTNSMIEGLLSKGQKVLLVDDMMTNGGSKAKFIQGIRATGAEVRDIAIVLDREQGGAEALAKENVEVHALITLKEMLKYMKGQKLVEDSIYQKVIDYLKSDKE